MRMKPWDNEIKGTVGDDVFDGTAARDKIEGRGGNDTLHGKIGADIVSGGFGNDALFGDEGNDTLNGAQGNDTLIGGIGNDVLNGGQGRDTLVFNAGDGHDTASHFNRGQDKLVFVGIDASDITTIRADVNHDGRLDTVITYDGGQIDLLGVSGAIHFEFQ